MTLPDFRFGYDTYQDVRQNLFLYSTPVLIAAGFFAFFGILPPQQVPQVTLHPEMVVHYHRLGLRPPETPHAAVSDLTTETLTR